jgi:HEAT repeat protein
LTSDLVRDAIVQLGISAVPALIDALRDDDPRIRQAACTALGQIGNLAAVSELTKRLQDSVSDVRKAACTALGQIGDPSAVPALIACLNDWFISGAAANALVQIGKPAVPALIETLTSPSNRVCIAACTALGEIGDPDAVPELIQCLEDADWSVRSAACTALAQIGDAAAIPALRVHAEIMEEARHALYKLGGTSMSLQEAVRTLSEQNQWGVLCRALTSNLVRAAIVQLGSIAVPALIDALHNDDPKIRQAACTALGHIGDTAAVPSLIQSLEDEDRYVRSAACNALGQIGDPSAVPALIACLDQREISEAAANALVQIGKPAVPALIEALTSPSNPVRSAACTVLGKIRDTAAVPVLVQCLKDTYSDVRCAACRALGKIRDTAAVPALIEQLKDTNRDVRKAACTALGQVRDSSAVPALISALHDEDVDVRIAATDALVNIGKAAIPALQEAITSGDPTIHKKVSGILNIIKQRMQR